MFLTCCFNLLFCACPDCAMAVCLSDCPVIAWNEMRNVPLVLHGGGLEGSGWNIGGILCVICESSLFIGVARFGVLYLCPFSEGDDRIILTRFLPSFVLKVPVGRGAGDSFRRLWVHFAGLDASIYVIVGAMLLVECLGQSGA